MDMKKSHLSLLIIASLLAYQPANAQRVGQTPNKAPMPVPTQATGVLSERIAAVVNDAVISTSDVRGRLALAILTSGLPDSMEIRQKLLPQVIRALIDEQLQMQEAKRIEITVSGDEIKQALEKLAQQNEIPGGDLASFLNSHGVPYDALTSQARATLSWGKVVQRELRPKVDISDDEVQAALERLKANAGKPEYLVSEIFLPVDNPKDEDQVKAFADSLHQQIRGGGNFAAIARQFSRSTGAGNGGDIGWIQDGQLPQEINKALMSSNKGDLIGPIRSVSGYHILGIRDQRTINAPAGAPAKEESVIVKQAFLLFQEGAKKEDQVKEVDRFRTSINGCLNLDYNMEKQFPSWTLQDLGELKVDEAPSWLMENIRDLPVGQPSKAITSDEGAIVLLVCGRKSSAGGVDRNDIVAAIGTERLELQARRLMRDLRRAAYVDVRLKSMP